MPYGKFNASWTPRPKKQKEPKENRAEKAAQPVTPTPVTPTPAAPAPAAPKQPEYVTDLRFLLIGRTVSSMLEFFCSMNKNLTDMLATEQMSLYIRELKTMQDITAVQRRLENFFLRFCMDDWTSPEDDPLTAEYQFSVSPAAHQTGALHISLQLVSANADLPGDWANADAIWLFADGALYDGNGMDGYIASLRRLIQSMNERGQARPVMLIQTQIEKTAHFTENDGRLSLPRREAKLLSDSALNAFGGLCRAPMPLYAIPVQVYGGLEYVGKDPYDRPRLHLSESGYFMSYVPIACHLPFLFTMQLILKERQLSLFEGEIAGGFAGAVGRYCQRTFGTTAWRPECLADEVE